MANDWLKDIADAQKKRVEEAAAGRAKLAAKIEQASKGTPVLLAAAKLGEGTHDTVLVHVLPDGSLILSKAYRDDLGGWEFEELVAADHVLDAFEDDGVTLKPPTYHPRAQYEGDF